MATFSKPVVEKVVEGVETYSELFKCFKANRAHISIITRHNTHGKTSYSVYVDKGDNRTVFDLVKEFKYCKVYRLLKQGDGSYLENWKGSRNFLDGKKKKVMYAFLDSLIENMRGFNPAFPGMSGSFCNA